jgi:membrane protein DedA with SNARE-associated domain
VPFFPEDATFILCGFLIQARTVKTIPALLVIYIGVLIADFIVYSFGRKYGRMVVCHRWFRRFLSLEKLQDLEDGFKRRGIFIILLGRHFIGLRVQIFIVSGILRMHPLKFLLADAVTVTFTIGVMVLIGYMGGHSLKDLGIHISKHELLGAFLLSSFFIGWLVFKYIQKKKTVNQLSYRVNVENPSEQHGRSVEGSVGINGSDLVDRAKGHAKKETYKKDSPRKSLAWIEPLLLLSIYCGIFLLFRHLGVWQFFTSQERLFRFIDSLGVWDEVGFVFLEAVQVVIPSIPGMFLNMLGGYLYGTFEGVILSTIGTTMGGYIVFLLSRKFGRQIISRYLPKTLMKRFENIPHNKGRFTILLLFLVPGFPKDYLCYTLGYLSAVEFFLVTGFGRLMGTFLETLGGDYIRRGRYQELFILAGVAIVIILLALVSKNRIEILLRKIHNIGYKMKKGKPIK